MSSLGLRHPATLAVSAAVGLIVSLLLLYFVDRSASVKSTPVVVAKQDIPAGVALDEQMLELADWPTHLKTFTAATSLEDLRGRVTRVPIFAGEPVSEAKVWGPGESGDIDDLLIDGERALSVPVNEMVGVDPDGLPGNFVDLIVTPRSDEGRAATTPVAEHLRVLAVNRSPDPKRPQPVRQLTLAVTLQQARAIESARAAGMLTALLRNFHETPSEQLPTPPMTNAQVASSTGGTSMKSPNAQTPREIEIILGTEKVSQ